MGRPTLQQSQELDERIKAVALDLFLDQGFDAVTMEAVAKASNITKRTLYMRYKDKTELFSAALRKSREEWKFDDCESDLQRDESLEQELLVLAAALMDQALNPRTIKLSRMANAQAPNFPEEITGSYNISLSPRVRSIVSVLIRHKQEIHSRYLESLDMTAELFLGLITGIPVRLAGMGMIRDSEFEARRLGLAVKLFLDAVRRREMK